MSIKNRVTDRAANGSMRPIHKGGRYGERLAQYTPWPWVSYNKSPSWWNRLYNNRPKRKEANALCRDITAGRRDAEAVIFPTAKKPHNYYW